MRNSQSKFAHHQRRDGRRQGNDNQFSGSDFLFNKTSLLSSALEKLKKKNKTSTPKRVNQQPIQLPNQQPSKKVKVNTQITTPTLTYTPLQKDLFNFYTINKLSLKNFETVPEPKLQIGSQVLTAVCDRGIGGRYLVTNLFRNKKAYIDYTNVSLTPTSDQGGIQALQSYQQPGDYIVGVVIKPRNVGKIQLSLSEIEQVNQKMLRIGQVLIGQIKSKEELGCHMKVKGIKKMKVYLPKSYISEDAFDQLSENKQVITVIKEIDEKKQLVKTSLITEQQISINLKGIQQAEMGKYQLEHYVVPGTLVNTKILKVLPNGVIVKFLKIFVGFIHADHLTKAISSYSNQQKILSRIIYTCNNPPTIFLSEKHRSISKFQPKRPLYAALEKPQQLREIQKSYFNEKQQFFAHPLQLHSEIENLNKFWIKQNNFFQHYQIMSSKKVGLKVGDIGKAIPFTNFKVFGQGQGKFRVMCLDVWNKVIKVSYDPKILVAKNLLFNTADIDEAKKYCGFVSNVNVNGVVVQFCNNIKGIISQRELQLNSIEINEGNIGESFEAYVVTNNSKKNYLGLTITPSQLRKTKKSTGQKENSKGESTNVGIIQSINNKSIHPIYLKIKKRLVKINIFDGIRPASLQDLSFIQNLQTNYQIGQKVQVYSQKGRYYLYPPEQLSDKNLRFCRIVSVQGNSLRVQTKQDQFRSCHITDVTDLISPHPLHEYQLGEYTIGRIVSDKLITLRKSLVINGLPDSMKQVTQLYGQDEKRGDYRARIQAVGAGALKLQSVVFGYIKTYGDKGCFISLSRNFDVRVDKSELSDHHLKNKQSIFTPNKLVICRLINSKILTDRQNAVQIDASLRQSVVKYGYPLNDEILENGVGLTVKGIVTGYVKGKALVRLQSSKLTGIIALKDYEEANENDTLQKSLPIGKTITCKIIEYSREGEKRLIRLSTLNKVFKKYEGLQTTFDCEARIIQLWDNFQSLSAIEAPERQTLQLIEDKNHEEAQYERLKKLLAQNEIDIEDNQEENLQQQAQNDEHQQEQQQMDAQEQQQLVQPQQIDQQKESPVKKAVAKQAKRKASDNQKQELQHKLTHFKPLPHPKQFYQSLVLANPTPESYLLYISSLLSTATPEEVRLQFQRAITSLTDIKDKDNMWISWLNTQLILGDFTGTVKKAVEANVGYVVYFRILQILCEEQNWQVAIEFGKKTLKKFNRQPKAYIAFLKMISTYERSGHQLSSSLSVKQIMRRATQCLKSNEVLQIEIHHAKSLFQCKQPQQGRNILEELISRYPKRADIWTVYIDQEVKSENIEKAKNLLERSLSIGLRKKSMISLLKKYLQIEKAHGTEETVAGIIERARSMATTYEQLDEEDDQIQDIE